jgi:hypothetical protein
MNALTTIAAALLMGTAACCAHTQIGYQAAPEKTTRFMGYRLELERDDVGTPLSAKAFDPQGKEVPVVLVPLRDVSVCVPKPVGMTAGPGPYCEPLSFLPDGTHFKSGSKTRCYYYWGTTLIYYPC